jgi:hypothetical protein
MTVIVSTIWGGRISILVDRRISRRQSMHASTVVDDDSNKMLIVQCHNAIFAIAYTGLAVAQESWMDCVIADCLAHRKLELAFLQPGANLLKRPYFALIDELRINLNGVLNSDPKLEQMNLELLIQGWVCRMSNWHPFSCKLKRGLLHSNGNRYFEFHHHPVAKFLREHPSGLWGETLGDDGGSSGAITKALETLRSTVGFSHDHIEQHLCKAILDRSGETQTVSPASVAVQLDPTSSEGQVTFTYYPQKQSANGHPFLTPWVMTPRMISAPSITASTSSPQSGCGDYLLGGFSDENTHLHVVSRLPNEHGMSPSEKIISFEFQQRPRAR